MARITGLLIGLFAALLLPACGLSNLDHDPEAVFQDPEIYRTSERIIDALQHGDAEAFNANISDALAGEEDVKPVSKWILSNFPQDEDADISLVYAEQVEMIFDDYPEDVFRLLYEIAGDTSIYSLTLNLVYETGYKYRIVGINFQEELYSLSSGYAFGLSGKSALHYLILLIAVAVPVFMIVTAVACFRNPLVRRKWLWIPFILVGLWGVTFDWTSGQLMFEMFGITADGFWYINFIVIHILGLGAVKTGLLTSWVISIGSPVGAALYWIYGRRGSRKLTPEEEMA